MKRVSSITEDSITLVKWGGFKKAGVRTVDPDMPGPTASGLVDLSLDREVRRATGFDQTPDSISTLSNIE